MAGAIGLSTPHNTSVFTGVVFFLDVGEVAPMGYAAETSTAVVNYKAEIQRSETHMTMPEVQPCE